MWVLPLSAAADVPDAPPPVAPEDPQHLLQVLQAMPTPRRRLVIFKAGGYVYSDMEALIDQSGLSHVLRLTNLIRKAQCVLAKPRWDSGRAVNLQQHRAAAAKAGVPFVTRMCSGSRRVWAATQQQQQQQQQQALQPHPPQQQ
ncbi:hypothetical protein OEZ85_004655 [Tetradesmus obliquus]|uniref:Uncharacterized protein n=1 Tax=Tetradesmus obliquus TaxID=3088 RepID=A0ABY8UPN6_TETOB|nr:hypothetical protein OEZ85_004655 [Tetradesmus obliquus]